jgi:hypothetical protein
MDSNTLKFGGVLALVSGRVEDSLKRIDPKNVVCFLEFST